jgi:menaquinone-specific isochorismate synthase
MIGDLLNIEAQLTFLYKAAKETAASRKRPLLASLTCPSPHGTPLIFFSSSNSSHGPAFYWDHPDEQVAMAGIGAASLVEPASPNRFDEAASLWQEVVHGALVQTETDAFGTGPIAFGGFSFDSCKPPSHLWRNYPPGLLVLPRFSLTSHREASWLTINTLLSGDIDPEAEAKKAIASLPTLITPQPNNAAFSPPNNLTTSEPHSPTTPWKELVGEATQAIKQGNADKIVLARALRLISNNPLRPVPILEYLRETYPSCALFAVVLGGSTFLGASPERLARLSHGQVQVDCLAGTAGRGSSPEEDERLAARLSSNSKERSEHEVVVRVLHEQLSHFCPHINMPSQPVILRLPNVQHLSTPLRCHLPNGENILQLVKAFHPSPAIGGFPKDVAMSFIREREELDRGWYGGPIGWMDRHGQGEFAVAIRSALIEQNEAHLFAGCGIMVDSDPDKEYQESDIKLESMLSALHGGRQ